MNRIDPIGSRGLTVINRTVISLYPEAQRNRKEDHTSPRIKHIHIINRFIIPNDCNQNSPSLMGFVSHLFWVLKRFS